MSSSDKVSLVEQANLDQWMQKWEYDQSPLQAAHMEEEICWEGNPWSKQATEK